MPGRPNLLLIMCDQLRADILGCYGGTYVQTPHIDRLARRGVVFDRAYSQTPVCVPARHGLISGQNPFELGLIENSGASPDIRDPLPAILRRHGYATFAAGKMHFAPPRRHLGFDRMFLSEEIPGHLQDDDFLLFLRENGYGHVFEPHGRRSELYYVPQVSELPEMMHTTAWTAAKTCELIRANRNRPFFMFCSFIKPHPPFDPSPPFDSLHDPGTVPLPARTEEERLPDDYLIEVQNDYKVGGLDNLSEEWERRIRAAYYGCVAQIDRQVGVILDTLDECGLTDNTMVVFTSDHGEMLGDHWAYGKRTFYEASARVPLIISHPQTLPAGHRRSQFATLLDIYASFAEAGGYTPPDTCRGFDLRPVCRDPGHTPRQRIHGEIGRGPALKMMLRFGDFKYVYHANGGVDTLFDLRQDPGEFHNLAAERPDICRDARRQMTEYYQSFPFPDVLMDDGLIQFERRRHEPKGFLDQRPRWPATAPPG